MVCGAKYYAKKYDRIMGNWMRKKIIMKTIQNVEFKKYIV